MVDLDMLKTCFSNFSKEWDNLSKSEDIKAWSTLPLNEGNTIADACLKHLEHHKDMNTLIYQDGMPSSSSQITTIVSLISSYNKKWENWLCENENSSIAQDNISQFSLLITKELSLLKSIGYTIASYYEQSY